MTATLTTTNLCACEHGYEAKYLCLACCNAEIKRLTRDLSFERAGTDSLQRQIQDRGETIDRLQEEYRNCDEQRSRASDMCDDLHAALSLVRWAYQLSEKALSRRNSKDDRENRDRALSEINARFKEFA